MPAKYSLAKQNVEEQGGTWNIVHNKYKIKNKNKKKKQTIIILDSLIKY